MYKKIVSFVFMTILFANAGSNETPHQRVDVIFPPANSVRKFHSIFPLGPIYKKWRNGIPIFPKIKIFSYPFISS